MKKLKKTKLVKKTMYLYDLINKDFFRDELPKPTINIILTSKKYIHYVPFDAWTPTLAQNIKINASSYALNQPLPIIVTSLTHEMTHIYNDIIENVSDTSRGGMYHNKHFARQAEQRGLNVMRTDIYGYALTLPNDNLLNWVANLQANKKDIND